MLRQKITILFVLFLGFVGFSIVFPLFPSMFLDPELHYFSSNLSLFTRNILLGLMLAMFPLGQFVGSPIFGRISDTYGRRPLLLFTLFCTALMFASTAFAVSIKSIPLLFVCRFITGIFEGNVTIASAVMADIGGGRVNKTKNFGWLITVSSTGWIVGPLLGGWLSNSALVPWFTYATPFWISSLFLFACFFMVMFAFSESLENKKRKKTLNIREIFYSFIRLFKRPILRKIYIANLCFYFACFTFFIYLGILLFHWFAATPAEIGNYEAYLSIFICLAPITFPYLARNYSHNKTLAIAGIGLSISLILLILFPTREMLIFTLILPSYFIALGMSFAALLISDACDEAEQGEALGLNQAVQVLSEAIVGLFGGLLIALWLYLPYLSGAVLCLASAGIALTLKRSAANS